jgi:hypothetical protein
MTMSLSVGGAAFSLRHAKRAHLDQCRNPTTKAPSRPIGVMKPNQIIINLVDGYHRRSRIDPIRCGPAVLSAGSRLPRAGR